MDGMFWFLVISDYRRGDTRVLQFDQDDEATTEYRLATERHRGSRDVEVVLISTDSEESLRLNYPHLFSERTDIDTALANLRKPVYRLFPGFFAT